MSRYINADALAYIVASNGDADFINKVTRLMIDARSIDIVRCQDCKHWVYNFNGCSRNPCAEPWHATDFCSYGERKEK